MAESGKTEAQPQKPRSVDWATLLPAVVFVLIVTVAGFAYWRHSAEVRAEQRVLAEEVEAAGLPAGYPLRLVPLPEQFVIEVAEHGSTQSTDGRPMDEWVVVGHTPSDYQAVFDFYKRHLLDAGMGQTQLISIPNSYFVEYGDAEGTAGFEIDAGKDGADTRVKITVHRLR